VLTDPVADYLTRVRNALRADHPEVEIPASRLKKEMTRILVEQGYLNGFEVEPTSVGESIRINLKYTEDRDPVINGMKRISRPGRRRYVASTTVPRVQGGMGTAIISTSAGVMTGHQAKEQGVGGDVIAYVWYPGRTQRRNDDEPNRKQASRDPRGSHRGHRPWARDRERPQGRVDPAGQHRHGGQGR
jgi:small subunit ribosomal protein S8